MRRYFCIIAIPFLTLVSFAETPALRITAPADGTVVAPGQSVTITVAAAPSVKSFVLLSPLGKTRKIGPDQFVLDIPPDTPIKQYDVTAIGHVRVGETVESDPISLDVESPLTPTQLQTDATMHLRKSGSTLPIDVMATFGDGSAANVSRSTRITYATSDPTIVTVDRAGTVTAIAPGNATITVSYQGVTTSLAVTVDAPIAEVPGDHLAPASTSTSFPPPNDALWNNSDVTFTISASDLGIDPSGVKRIIVYMEGAQLSTTATAGSAATATVATEGITLVTYNAQDNAGNVEQNHYRTVQIDKTAPTISGSSVPAPNVNGWTNTPVVVSFICADALSGLAPGFPPAPIAVSSEGANQQVSSSCADLAGNVGSAIVGGINIDKTPPDAYNVFVPATADIAVFGKDALSGVAAGALVPVSDVIRTRVDDDEDRHEDRDRDDRKFEVRTYQFSDLAGNATILTERLRKGRNSVSASFDTIQYGTSPAIRLPRNRESFEWAFNGNGTLRELKQHLSIEREGRDQEVEARYSSIENKTVIHQEDRDEDKTAKSGLVLLQMTTQKGNLNIQF